MLNREKVILKKSVDKKFGLILYGLMLMRFIYINYHNNRREMSFIAFSTKYKALWENVLLDQTRDLKQTLPWLGFLISEKIILVTASQICHCQNLLY